MHVGLLFEPRRQSVLLYGAARESEGSTPPFWLFILKLKAAFHRGRGPHMADYLQHSLELQQVFTVHVLPQLPVDALGCLACSSTALRGLVYASEAQQAWRQAISAHLPSIHPSPQGDRLGIQQCLQRRWTAACNLGKGEVTELVSVPKDASVSCGKRVDTYLSAVSAFL